MNQRKRYYYKYKKKPSMIQTIKKTSIKKRHKTAVTVEKFIKLLVPFSIQYIPFYLVVVNLVSLYHVQDNRSITTMSICLGYKKKNPQRKDISKVNTVDQFLF